MGLGQRGQGRVGALGQEAAPQDRGSFILLLIMLHPCRVVLPVVLGERSELKTHL